MTACWTEKGKACDQQRMIMALWLELQADRMGLAMGGPDHTSGIIRCPECAAKMGRRLAMV
jgi:hypothetical protein